MSVFFKVTKEGFKSFILTAIVNQFIHSLTIWLFVVFYVLKTVIDIEGVKINKNAFYLENLSPVG